MHHLFRVLATGTLVFLLIGCSAESADNTANSTDTSNASAPESTANTANSTDTSEASAPKSTAELGKSAPRTKPKAEPAPRNDNRATAEPPVRVETPKPKTMTIPAGTELSIILIDSIRTDTNKPGDVFLASLASPLTIDGRVGFDQGTKVEGRVEEVESSGRVKGLAKIQLVLTDIIVGDQKIPISTKPFVEVAESDKGRDAKIGAVGAVAGALIGGLTGGKKGAVIGGAAGGTGAVVATKGKELSYPSESRLTFALDRNVEVSK